MEKERDTKGYGLEKIPASVVSYYGAGEEVLCQMTGKKISKAACLELGRVYAQNQRFCVNCNSIYRLRPECILQGLPEAKILFADFEKYAFFSSGNGDGDGKESESKQQPEGKPLVLKSSSSQRNSLSQSQQEKKFWCPEYQEEIPRERCLNNCSHLQKNRQACSALNCASPWRLCILCVEMKPPEFSFLENLGIAKKCATISPTTPYCKVHLNDRKKIPDFFINQINQITGSPKPVEKEGGRKVDAKFKAMSHSDRIEFMQKLLSENNGSLSVVANKLGVSDGLVGFYNTANKASSEIKELLRTEKINFSVFVRLAIESPQTQKELTEKIIADDLKGKAAVAFINKTVGPAKRRRKESAKKTPRPDTPLVKKKRGPYKKSAPLLVKTDPPAPSTTPITTSPTTPLFENIRKSAAALRESVVVLLSDTINRVILEEITADENPDGSFQISTKFLQISIKNK